MERRRHQRKHNDSFITFVSTTGQEEAANRGVLWDISSAGLCVISAKELQIGETVEIISGADFLVGKTARVKWRDERLGFSEAGLYLE